MKNHNRTSVIIMLIFILLGIVAGTAIYMKYPIAAEQIHGFIKSGNKRTIVEVFREAFDNTFIILLILMFSGFSSVSQPIELSALIYRGIVLGISLSYTYAVYAVKGVFICVLMILPHALMTSIILVLAVRESMRMSTAVAIFAFKGQSEVTDRPDIKLYLLKFLILLLFLIAASLIDCVITYLLTGMLITN